VNASLGAGKAEAADGVVVRLVLAGDVEAYRILVERYRRAYGRYAVVLLRDPDAAADALQEAFIRAYEGLAGCRNPDRFGAWFFRILQNQCRNALGRMKETVEAERAGLVARDRADGAVERGELADALQAALAALTAEQREAFLMKHVEGRSYEEMAQLLGVGVDALKMRVYRARDALREMLGGHQ
jgi:RNA polymerase sigma-70 factor (ECF subfamily)